MNPAREFQIYKKAAEWNTKLAHEVRVANEQRDRMKARVVLLTAAGLIIGFVIGVVIT